jgi:hypothetical protein
MCKRKKGYAIGEEWGEVGLGLDGVMELVIEGKDKLGEVSFGRE